MALQNHTITVTKGDNMLVMLMSSCTKFLTPHEKLSGDEQEDDTHDGKD